MSDNTKFVWTDGTSDEISLTMIDDNFTAKYGRQKADLKELSVGDKVRTISSNAFKMCKNLEKITMSSHVEKIGAFAFAWCEKLEEINLPDGLENVSISVFTFCSSLKKSRHSRQRYADRRRGFFLLYLSGGSGASEKSELYLRQRFHQL